MKRYIRSSVEESCIEITVDLYYDCGNDIMASIEAELSDEEQLELIKKEVAADFEGFIDILTKRIKCAVYELLEEPENSSYPGSNSWYFVVCNKHDYEELPVELILNVRVSDHRLSRYKKGDKTWNRYEARKKYYQRELENYRFLNDINPEYVTSTLVEIKVGGTTCENFLNASNHVINVIKNYI